MKTNKTLKNIEFMLKIKLFLITGFQQEYNDLLKQRSKMANEVIETSPIICYTSVVPNNFNSCESADELSAKIDQNQTYNQMNFNNKTLETHEVDNNLINITNVDKCNF